MKMNKLRSVLCLLLAALMTVSLWGCQGSKDDPIPTLGPLQPNKTDAPSQATNPTEEPTQDPGTDPEPRKVITIEEMKNAKIVYPEGVYARNGAVETAIYNLKDMIKSRYKVLDLPVTNDKLVTGHNVYKEHEFEILIGDTNREESTTMFGDLLINDYGYELCGTKIVIKGGCETALVTAINAFKDEIVVPKKSGSTNFFDMRYSKLEKTNYVALNGEINGVHISKFEIVYPRTSQLYEKELAQRLANHLTLISGYTFACHDDTTPATEHEILIGKTNRSFSITTKQGGAVETDSNHVAIIGANAYEIGQAEKTLVNLLTVAAAQHEAKLTLPAVTEAVKTNDISIMSYNIYGFDYYKSRCDNICTLVTKYLPDIVGFQEPDLQMMSYFTNMLDYYENFDGRPRHTKPTGGTVPDASGANSVSPIYYAKDRYEFILGDTKWCTGTPDEASKLPNSSHYRMYTYAMLRDTYTGVEFIVVNHHLDFDDDIQSQSMKLMFKFFQENYTDVPVIMLGDFNATANTNVISKVVKEQAGFTSLFDMASRTGVQKPANIDWIFAMGCCVDGLYYTVCDETFPDTKVSEKYGDGKKPSDHAAVYAELKFSIVDKHTHDWSSAAAQGNWIKAPSVPTRPK